MTDDAEDPALVDWSKSHADCCSCVPDFRQQLADAEAALVRLRGVVEALKEALREQRRQMNFPGLDEIFASTMRRMIAVALDATEAKE